MEGAAQTLLSNAGQLLHAEYQLLRGVGGEVAELRDDLATMSALLRMQSEADDGAVDHFVREWMKQLRELAYDAEDCVDLYNLRMNCRPGDGVRARLKRLFYTLFPRRRLAGEISALRARAAAISQRHSRYGVDREALRRSPSLSAPPVLASSAQVLSRANSHEHHQPPIGIEDQVDTMVNRLQAEQRELRVFSVVGFGGLGKTTLAMEVCRRLETDFQRLAMVSVSLAFEPGRDLKPLLKRVVEQVVKVKTDNKKNIKEEAAVDEIDDLDDNKLAEKLEKLLKDKRYLIVIDDVWTIRAWESIQSVFPYNKCGSRIIVTTRIENVAKVCSPSIGGHYIHHMQPLKFADSKNLFLSRTFGNIKDWPKELEDMMLKILKRCGGLPLAIVSIASVLAGYTSPGSLGKWESIYKSIGSQMESNPTLEGMRQIVTLSYNHLPYELKVCMMYLSIFPEDCEIDKYRLLCRWIAEGLVLEKRGLTQMEVAESYLDELVSRNMIQFKVRFGYYWKVETCRVHDTLLEVMVSKSLECNFVSLLGGQYAGTSYNRIRRLSIQGDDDDDRRAQSTERPKKNMAGHGIEAMDVEHVRSVSVFQHKGQKLLDHLQKFTLLRVLDLEGCEGLTDDHMRHICRLYLLRFLSLRRTDIREVPPQIEKLEHLQTFDVCDTPVGGLPETVKKLYKLERLQINFNNDANRMWKLPLGLRKMKELREVGFSVLANDVEVARDVGELEQLQELIVYVDDKIVYDKEVLEQFAKSLSKSYSLRRLIIGDVGFEKGALDFLHQMPAAPRLLRHLMIAGGINCGLPPWIRSLTYLVQFNMSWGQLVGDQLFDGLCECPSLKTICVQQMCYGDRELVARTRHKFPGLTNLIVGSDSRLPNVIGFEKGSMVKLEMLLVNFHKNKEIKIIGIEHLTSLKEVHLLGDMSNPALGRAQEQLKDENKRRRQESNNLFQIVVKYE